MDLLGRYARGENTDIPYMWWCWWSIMIPGCVWEYSSLENWQVSPSHSHTFSLSLSFSPPTLTQTQSQHNRWSWSLENTGTSELVMNTSSILMAWESAERCQAPVKQNMGLHFKQALLRTRREAQMRSGQYLAGANLRSSAVPVYCEWQ